MNDAPLVDAGAAGAFVHGLEDEYMEVRTAAVGTILKKKKREYQGFAQQYKHGRLQCLLFPFFLKFGKVALL